MTEKELREGREITLTYIVEVKLETKSEDLPQDRFTAYYDSEYGEWSVYDDIAEDYITGKTIEELVEEVGNMLLSNEVISYARIADIS